MIQPLYLPSTIPSCQPVNRPERVPSVPQLIVQPFAQYPTSQPNYTLSRAMPSRTPSVQPSFTLLPIPVAVPSFSSSQSVLVVVSIVIANVTSPFTNTLSQSFSSTIATILSIDPASVVCLNATIPISRRRLGSQLSTTAQGVKILVPESSYPGKNISSITDSVINVLRVSISSNQFNKMFHSLLRTTGMAGDVLPTAVALLGDYYWNKLPTLMPTELGAAVSNSIPQGSASNSGQTIIITSVTLSGVLLICMGASLVYYWKYAKNFKGAEDPSDVRNDIEHNLEYSSSTSQSGSLFSNPARMEKQRKKLKAAASSPPESLADLEGGITNYVFSTTLCIYFGFVQSFVLCRKGWAQ